MSHTIFTDKSGVLKSYTTVFCLGGGYYGVDPINNILWVNKEIKKVSKECFTDNVISRIINHKIENIVFCGRVHLCSNCIISKQIEAVTFLEKITFKKDSFSEKDSKKTYINEIHASKRKNRKLYKFCLKRNIKFFDLEK